MDLPIPMWWAEFNHRLKTQKRLQEAQPANKNGLGAFSAAEWEAARKRHREKMNGK